MKNRWMASLMLAVFLMEIGGAPVASAETKKNEVSPQSSFKIPTFLVLTPGKESPTVVTRKLASVEDTVCGQKYYEATARAERNTNRLQKLIVAGRYAGIAMIPIGLTLAAVVTGGADGLIVMVITWPLGGILLGEANAEGASESDALSGLEKAILAVQWAHMKDLKGASPGLEKLVGELADREMEKALIQLKKDLESQGKDRVFIKTALKDKMSELAPQAIRIAIASVQESINKGVESGAFCPNGKPMNIQQMRKAIRKSERDDDEEEIKVLVAPAAG